VYIHNVFIKALLRETASSPQIARISASKRPGLEYFVRLPGSPAIGLQPQQLLGLADLGYVAQPLALLPEFARKRFTSVATHGSASRSIAFQDGHVGRLR
jgi:prepilin-type processing-associated H-X9-DG protein